MKAKVEDVHDSHGLVFTLNLEKSDSSDDTVVDFLNKELKPSGFTQRFFLFYFQDKLC